MLKNTFLHIPGVGERTELRLWRSGICSWEDFLRVRQVPLPPGLQDHLRYYVEKSLDHLSRGDAGYFQRHLPPREHWRLYPDFKERTAFVDIETTGGGSHALNITVIGLYNGSEYKVFIQGRNLEEFQSEVERYDLLVTYNGKCFDLPVLKNYFGQQGLGQAHLDLRYFLRRIGYFGGLKRVEESLGIRRPPSLRGVDGYFAVLLWYRHLRGDARALDALIRYNWEDVVNLQALLEIGFNRMIASLPLPLMPLPLAAKPTAALSFDPTVFEELKRELRTPIRP